MVSKNSNNINKDVSNHTLLTRNNHRTHPGLGDNLVRICPPGNHLATGAELEVGVEVVNQDAARARPKIQLSINDSYCLTSPVSLARPVSCVSDVQRQNFHAPVHQPVLCPVVSPVPFVLNVRGQSQKKDGSPSLKVNTEINFVKSVFSVDHCVFAPTVSSAHNVANAQLVEVVPPGCKSESSVHLKGRGLHSSVQNQTSSGERSLMQTPSGTSTPGRLCKPYCKRRQ